MRSYEIIKREVPIKNIPNNSNGLIISWSSNEEATTANTGHIVVVMVATPADNRLSA